MVIVKRQGHRDCGEVRWCVQDEVNQEDMEWFDDVHMLLGWDINIHETTSDTVGLPYIRQ